MNYQLTKSQQPGPKGPKGKGKTARTMMSALKNLLPLLKHEKKNLAVAFVSIIINSASNLVAPIIISYAIDQYIQTGNYQGLLAISGILLVIYLCGLVASYLQTSTMGGIGRRVIFNLRNAIFNKLQELPVAFFNENKAGDLISRMNNDTDKINQFFAQALMQLIGSLFMITGTGIFLLSLNIKLGAAALVPALGVLIVTQFLSGWVKKVNLASLQSLGSMSGEIQESIENYKVIVAFNRKDYFREKFNEANQKNFGASVKAGIASNIFIPIYGLASNLAQLIVLAYGITLILSGNLTVGLLIGFFIYVNNFYNPLRQLAAVWSSFQIAMAGLDRISEVLALKSNMDVIEAKGTTPENLLEFKDVSFAYPGGKTVLKNIDLTLRKGKTYALVGPTGGGKTTTASLMARLYDPTEGTILLNGKDIRAYEPGDRTRSIGFILQEPFLFAGTVRDNILYGNEEYQQCTNEELREIIEKAGLTNLLARFENGLETNLAGGGDAISLGQKQLIAFIRSVLRKPEILILDEATANIDTVTEQLLEEILRKLPEETTKVIIAHRLNTISNADEICFVNSGEIIKAGSMEHAVEMLLHGKRES